MSEPTTDTPTTDVPVPAGTTTAGKVKQITVKRAMPELLAVKYDGSNAVQVAGWLIGQGTACQVSMTPGSPPCLLTPGGSQVSTGYVLANLEVIREQELGTVYEKVKG